MEESRPSHQEWRDLYHTAIEFKESECWNWMSDTDLFGVQNPANGIIGYCCIMGELNEILGLVVYPGTEALAGYLKIQSANHSPDAIQFLHFQKCLTLTFENRKYLKEPDLKVIKDLGLKFRGAQDWPLFRNYQPGYMPWYLNEEEALYLTALIPQALDVAFRKREDANLLVSSQKGRYLVRIPVKAGETLAWKDEWREFAPVEKTVRDVPPLDELRLQRIKKTVSRRQGVWEIDQFYSPGVVDEGGRPYFPYVFLWVDHDTGFVLHVRVAGLSDYQFDFYDQFLGLVEKIKILPDEILIQSEEVLRLVEPIASRFGIRIKTVANLPALQKARNGLFSFFADK